MSTGLIDEYYDLALKNGAIGGKLIGAGGGGFLMFYTEDKIPLRRAMADAGLREVRFRFDFEGTKVVVQWPEQSKCRWSRCLPVDSLQGCDPKRPRLRNRCSTWRVNHLL